MKIKILSNDKGVILAAVLPTDRRTRNLTECAPHVVGNNRFHEIELPKGTRGTAISGLLEHSWIKRVKETFTLDTLDVAEKSSVRKASAKKTRR